MEKQREADYGRVNPTRKKKTKQRKELSWFTRCYSCGAKVKLSPDSDPDKEISKHRGSPECFRRDK